MIAADILTAIRGSVKPEEVRLNWRKVGKDRYQAGAHSISVNIDVRGPNQYGWQVYAFGVRAAWSGHVSLAAATREAETVATQIGRMFDVLVLTRNEWKQR